MRKQTGLLFLVAMAALVCAPGSTAGAAEPLEAANLDTDPHLMGWWKFDETAGDTAKDSSKHDRNGVLTGGLSFDENSTEGRIGKALEFGGGEHLVQITDYKGVSGTKPRTVAVWIKTGASRGNIVSWGKQDFGQMWFLHFYRGHVSADPGGGYYYMEASVHDKTWHHVAAVVHEAELPNVHDDVTLYLNGKIAKIDRIGLLDLWPIETGAELDVAIGKGFKGGIDELRIYDRALTDEEIKSLYDLAK